ncbi:MAG: tetratricopeptide repeat protein [Verrucomicrobia bacterium]|nr:tetratricopeptide repeat protein [Verrucomicrobiota bacterium]
MESEVVELPLWQQAWAWFEKHKQQTVLITGGVAVIGLVVAFFVYRQDQADITAGEALSNVAMPQMAGGPRVDTAEAYLKVAATYPSSRAGARAILLAAASFFVEGKYAEAKTQFDKFTRDHRDSPYIGEALLGVAACLDAQGKSNEAIAAYKDLVDRHSSDPVLPQARFALARLYEAQNKPEQARTLFEEVEHSNPYGSLGSEAGMRLEELKTKFPNMAPPVVPTMTNTAPAKVVLTNVQPTKATPTNATPVPPKKP